MPHFGQRFSPSVDVPNGFSRVASARSWRCRFMIRRIASDHDREGDHEREELGRLIHGQILDGWWPVPGTGPRRASPA